ncbi:MAG: iron-containing alcohol dehydrogenase, partial [Clostridia bacterium]|nr:iron-containing alcohol dehydrogenase [Clostridia bacterium]
MQAFQFNTTPQVIFRPRAANEIGALARLKCGARPLLVTDPGLRRIGLCDPALHSLAEAGLGVTVFDAVEADPSLATVMAAVEAGRAAEVTGVIGFGGGSSLDVAKVVALLLGSGEEIDAAWGVGNAKGPRLPLILVPTTA